MFTGVYHIGYHTDDIEAAIAFLEATFGGRVVGRTTAGNGNKMAFIKCGEAEIELIEPASLDSLGGRTGLILDHVGYQVSDIDASVEELRAKGVAFMAPAPHKNAVGARLVYLDPKSALGTRLHLTEPPV